MTEAEIIEALDGTLAFQVGSKDSGIDDPALIQRIADVLAAMTPDEARGVVSRWVRTYLTDEAIASGYGWQDARDAVGWIDHILP